MTPEMILQRANADGVVITISPAGGVKASGDQDRVNSLVPLLQEHKLEILRLLQKTTDGLDYPKPFIFNDELRIPGNCHPRYRWWAGGQTVMTTLLELEASDNIIKRYCGKKYE